MKNRITTAVRLLLSSFTGLVGLHALAATAVAEPDASASEWVPIKQNVTHGSPRASQASHARLEPAHAGRPVHASHASRQRYRARPSSGVGISIYSGYGPGYGPYYPRYRDRYYYGPPVYSGPVYVTPPPVYYGAPVVPQYPPSPSPSPNPQVVQVQENLRRLGYYKSTVDGLIGPGTRTAIRAYQVDRGLPVTGRMDRELLLDLGL